MVLSDLAFREGKNRKNGLGNTLLMATQGFLPFFAGKEDHASRQ